MATNIEHADTLDFDELATLAREQQEIIDDAAEYSEEEVEDAKETVQVLADLVGDLGYHLNEVDGEAVADALESSRDEHSSEFIADHYFVDAMRELVQDIGDLPAEIPAYLEIDWDATAENLKQDYSDIEIEGNSYYIR